MSFARRHVRVLAVSVIAAVSMVVAGCSPYYSGGTTVGGKRGLVEAPPLELSPLQCDELLDSAIDLIRNDDKSGLINEQMQVLTESCDAEYDTAVDYGMAAWDAKRNGPEKCSVWTKRDFDKTAIKRLKADGLCKGKKSTKPKKDSAKESKAAEPTKKPKPAPTWPEGGLGWNLAGDYVGTVQRVCGPLMSKRGTEYGVFVNVGEDYPSQGRFTFVIWGDWWLDPIPGDSVICATGRVSLYKGVTQMELDHPNDLEIWN
jgi:hypothetical protein